MQTEHFLLRYSELDSSKMSAYADELEANYQRIVDDLLQSETAQITGRFYPDQRSYFAATGYEGTGSVQGSRVFSVLTVPVVLSTPVHEFAHNVTLHVNPSAPDYVWLWESVAVYEAGEFLSPGGIPCLADRNFPNISTLGRDGSCSVYRVGYTIIELVVMRWGEQALRDLIAANANVQGTLGITAAQFQSAWEQFLEERYL